MDNNKDILTQDHSDPFVMVSWGILFNLKNDAALKVYLVLKSFIFKNGKNYCFPKYDTLEKLCHQSRPKLASAIKYLIENKYLKVEKIPASNGFKRNKYTLLNPNPNNDFPNGEKKESGNDYLPSVNSGGAEFSASGKNVSSQNINKPSVKNARSDAGKFNPPTKDEVIKYCTDKNYNIAVEHFFDYYSTNNWKMAKGKKITNWKLAVSNWYHNDKRFKKNKNGEYEYATAGNDKRVHMSEEEIEKLGMAIENEEI